MLIFSIFLLILAIATFAAGVFLIVRFLRRILVIVLTFVLSGALLLLALLVLLMEPQPEVPLEPQVAQTLEVNENIADFYSIIASAKHDFSSLPSDVRTSIEQNQALGAPTTSLFGFGFYDLEHGAYMAIAWKKSGEPQSIVLTKQVSSQSSDVFIEFMNTQNQARQQCLGSNGEHLQLVAYVQSNLAAPQSFEHVETNRFENNDSKTILMRFYANNAEGVRTLQSIKATVDKQNCEVLSVFE